MQGGDRVRLVGCLLDQCHLNVAVLLTALGWPVAGTLVLRRRRTERLDPGTPDVYPHPGPPGTPCFPGQRAIMPTHNASLLKVSCHDDDLHIVLPAHPPEVFDGVVHGALGGNVLSGSVLVAL